MSAHLLNILKSTAGKNRTSLVIPVGAPFFARLRPIGTSRANINPDDVKRLTIWRNRHVKSFLTEFVATNLQTASWLETVVGPDEGKILFMVDLPDGTTIGHVGLGFIDWKRGYGEADAIVRGLDAPGGLMKKALQVTIQWAKDQLGLEDIWVRVRSDNPAVAFYQKTGFIEQKRVSLDFEESNGFTRWFESPQNRQAKASLVYMKYKWSD